ncbi:MAG: hypothetical protein ACI9VR_001678 [Cognaticolwellia sp.]|jgi:hypothetical protein
MYEKAWVDLETRDGRVTRLGPGAVIGRLPGSALVLGDDRLSAQHARVRINTNGRLELKAYAINTPICHEDFVARQFQLARGSRYDLLPSEEFVRVLDLSCPGELPSLHVELHGERVAFGSLVGGQYWSVLGEGEPGLVPGHLAEALVRVTWGDQGFVVAECGGCPVVLHKGVRQELQPGLVVELCGVSIQSLGEKDTRGVALVIRRVGPGLLRVEAERGSLQLRGREAGLLELLLEASPASRERQLQTMAGLANPSVGVRKARNSLRNKLQKLGIPRDAIYSCDRMGNPVRAELSSWWWSVPLLRRGMRDG